MRSLILLTILVTIHLCSGSTINTLLNNMNKKHLTVKEEIKSIEKVSMPLKIEDERYAYP